MSHKFSAVHRHFRSERPAKKRVASMTLSEFRWWKYCHLRAAYGFMFDWKRINDPQYMNMIRPAYIAKMRGSWKTSRRWRQ